MKTDYCLCELVLITGYSVKNFIFYILGCSISVLHLLFQTP